MKCSSAKQRPLLLWTVVATIGLGATPTFAQLRTKLLDADIRATVSDNTVDYPAPNGTMVKAHLAPDGTLRAKYEGNDLLGSWAARDDMICFDFPGRGKDACWSLFRLPDGQLQLFTSSGEPAGYLRVTAGNPNKF